MPAHVTKNLIVSVCGLGGGSKGVGRGGESCLRAVALFLARGGSYYCPIKKIIANSRTNSRQPSRRQHRIN